jgi:EpsI family protein
MTVLTALLYWPATQALWQYWTTQPFLGGHGPLIAGLAAWQLYLARNRVDHAPVHPAPGWLVLLLICSFAAVIFWCAGIQTLYMLALPGLMWLTVRAAFGRAVAMQLLVPIGFLYFGMPAWNYLAVPLQHLTVRAVGLLAPIVGLPITVSGTLISFPSGSRFEVTDACSGVGFLVQGLAVATLLGELEAARTLRRLQLLTAMVAAALLTNWARVLMLLAIGFRYGMQNPIVAHWHLQFGYIVFAIALIAFVWLATRTPAPSMAESRTREPSADLSAGVVAATVAALASGPLVFLVLREASHQQDQSAQLQLPGGRLHWLGPTSTNEGSWRPVFVGRHVETSGAYRNDESGRGIELMIIGYAAQEQGRELINEENSLLGEGDLEPVSTSYEDVGSETYRETLVVDRWGKHSVIWSIYRIDQRTFVVPVFAQLWYGLRSFTGSSPYSAEIAIRSPCEHGCPEARSTLQDFAQNVLTASFSAPRAALSSNRAATGNDPNSEMTAVTQSASL